MRYVLYYALLPGQARGLGSPAPDRAGLWPPALTRRVALPGDGYSHNARKAIIRA
jgi:hypothetical protein